MTAERHRDEARRIERSLDLADEPPAQESRIDAIATALARVDAEALERAATWIRELEDGIDYNTIADEMIRDLTPERADWRRCPECGLDWPHPSATSGMKCPPCSMAALRAERDALACQGATGASGVERPPADAETLRKKSRAAWRAVSEALANPRALDCDEWVRTVMDAVEDYGDAFAAALRSLESSPRSGGDATADSQLPSAPRQKESAGAVPDAGLVEALRDAIEMLEHYGPAPDHLGSCVPSITNCDMTCVEAARFAEDMGQLRAALAAYAAPRGEGENPMARLRRDGAQAGARSTTRGGKRE